MSIDKFALVVGINDYVGTDSDLNGCVNDANDWRAFLEAKGYQVTTLIDRQATRQAFLDTLRAIVAKLGYRDRLVVTYSGHGSWVPDQDGDEADGRDEVLVMHDFGYVTDDDLNSVFRSRAYGTRVTFISDSCHSGTVNRFANFGPTPDRKTARFLNPTLLGVDEKKVEEFSGAPVAKALARNNGILVSGCDDPEYSYDAYIDGRFNGAFTRTALNVYKDGMTPRQWHEAIRTFLPSTAYPQSPQLQGTWYQRNKWVAFD